MERIENIGFGGLKLIQDTEQFRYGIDAVILSDFAYSLYPEFDNAIDLGTGNGIIPVILSHKNSNAHICGIDVQEAAVDIAKRNSSINGLDERLSFFHGDITRLFKAKSELKAHLRAFSSDIEGFDMVVCNPPYFAKGGAIPAADKAKFIARHETTARIEDFIKAAALLLKRQGHFFMVHRPSRLADIFYYCRKHGLEPKDMRLVVPKPSEAPNIALIHCKKGGGRELNVMKELAVYEQEGCYSEEIEKIYERK